MKKLFGINENLILTDDVAVIGSAPTLMDLSEGESIDKFGTVIRFNGAKVKGYENKVGAKTDLICVGLDIAYFSSYPFIPASGNVVNSESKNRLQNALILSALNPTAKIITWAWEKERAEKNKQHENYKYLQEACGQDRVYSWATEKHENEIKDNYQGNRILKEYGLPELLSSGKGMRTGFRTVLMLVKSGIVPTLFGFDVDPALESAKHYYDNSTSDKFDVHPAHDFRGEMAALIELRKNGLVNIVG
jgi:hypothetical protein